MKKSGSQKIAPGAQGRERWAGPIYDAADSVKNPSKYPVDTAMEASVKPGESPAFGAGANPLENHPALEPGKSYSVQAVCKDDRGNRLAFDLGRGFSPYIPGNKDQRLFLNGNNTLIAKQKKDNCYISVHFEKDEKKGKYCLYLDGFGQTVYFSVGAEDGTTEDKRRASHFEFYDFQNGDKLKEIPSDSFCPVVTAFKVRSGGQLTDSAIEFGYRYPRLSRYDPTNPYQKFAVCCCGDQLVVFSDSMGLKGEILLTPEEGGADDYLFHMIHCDDAGNEVGGYLCLGENGKLDGVTENKEVALHFGLADSAFLTAGFV